MDDSVLIVGPYVMGAKFQELKAHNTKELTNLYNDVCHLLNISKSGSIYDIKLRALHDFLVEELFEREVL